MQFQTVVYMSSMENTEPLAPMGPQISCSHYIDLHGFFTQINASAEDQEMLRAHCDNS